MSMRTDLLDAVGLIHETIAKLKTDLAALEKSMNYHFDDLHKNTEPKAMPKAESSLKAVEKAINKPY